MRIVQFTLLALLTVPAGPTAAQWDWDRDRNWDNRDLDRGYNDQRLDNVARRLSNQADNLWNMIRNSPEFQGSQYSYLRNAVRDVAREARQYEAQPSEVRARRVIDRAEDIRRFADRTRLPYDFRNRLSGLERQVIRLGRVYGYPYEHERRMARTDPYYDDWGRNDGFFRWRGRVDGTDVIYIQGNRVRIDHRQAQSITDSSFELPSPLPRSSINVQLERIRGRGRVQIIQQPSPSNNFTAAVLIEDDASGADYYEFELRW